MASGRSTVGLTMLGAEYKRFEGCPNRVRQMTSRSDDICVKFELQPVIPSMSNDRLIVSSQKSSRYFDLFPGASKLRSSNNFRIEQIKFGIVFERPGKKYF